MKKYEDIQNVKSIERAEDFRHLDLRRVASDVDATGSPWTGLRASAYNEQSVEVLYCDGRAGVAWGADVIWTDASSPDDALRRFFGVDGLEMIG